MAASEEPTTGGMATNHEAPVNVAFADNSLEVVNSAALQRGRVLTTLVVTGICALVLWNAFHSFWFERTMNTLSFLLNCVLLAFVYRVAVRGGKWSTGFLMFIHVIAFFKVALFVLLLQVSLLISGTAVPSLRVNDLDARELLHGNWHSLSILGMGLWAGFACWVLFLSKDARLYRHVQQHSPPPEIDPFEWAPSKR